MTFLKLNPNLIEIAELIGIVLLVLAVGLLAVVLLCAIVALYAACIGGILGAMAGGVYAGFHWVVALVGIV
jgi:hypothetical protein